MAEQEVALTLAIEHAESAGDLDRVNELEAQAWLDGPGAAPQRIGSPLRDLFLAMNGIALAAPELQQETAPPAAAGHLERIDCPTLLVDGDLDFDMIGQHHQVLHRAISGSERFQMQGVAHLPSMEQPAVFNRRLERFLATV